MVSSKDQPLFEQALTLSYLFWRYFLLFKMLLRLMSAKQDVKQEFVNKVFAENAIKVKTETGVSDLQPLPF